MDHLPPRKLRTLLAVLDLHRQGWPVTIRGIMRRLGHRSTNQIQKDLRDLEGAGLIRRGMDSYGGKIHGAGALAPACTLRAE